MKVVIVLGTRPEAIKLGPVARALRRRGGVDVRICSTGQHVEMLQPMLRLFEMSPDYDLQVMQSGGGLTQCASAILAGTDRIFEAERPDWVVVQGDTTTVAMAGLAAFYRRVPLAHVEAGLRSGDRHQPFPEEVHRRITSITADLHLAPTAGARQNLLEDGIQPETILVTGNPGIDALHWVASQPLPDGAAARSGPVAECLQQARRTDSRLILVTVHRRENHGAPLASIAAAIRTLASQSEHHLRFLCPVHLNPSVADALRNLLGSTPNVTLCPPLDYPSLVHAMDASWLVLTDSGGIQEEAPGLRVPVLVLRETTERPEGVEAGVARLVGSGFERIVSEVKTLAADPAAHARMRASGNPYGDGLASERIADALLGTPAPGEMPLFDASPDWLAAAERIALPW